MINRWLPSTGDRAILRASARSPSAANFGVVERSGGLESIVRHDIAAACNNLWGSVKWKKPATLMPVSLGSQADVVGFLQGHCRHKLLRGGKW